MNRVKNIGRQTFLSLKIRNFRLYFIGQSISWCGTWMQTIAQGLLMLQLTGSGTALGFMVALQFMPSLLFGAMAGVLTDRYSKRKIIFICQTASGVLALLLGLLVAFNWIEVWMVYAVALAHGFIIALDNPARHAFLMEMVGKDAIKNAVSLNSSLVNFARIAGPALAGIMIATMGLVACFIFNAVSYIAVLVVLYIMDGKALNPSPRAPRIKGQLMEGIRYVKANPPLRNTLIMAAIVGLFAYEFPVILPLFAEFTFNGGPNGYALLTSAMGVGAIIGGLLSAHQREATPYMLSINALLLGVIILITSFAPTLIIAAIAMVVVGIFSVSFTALANTILQLESAPAMRGRVMSLWTVAFLGSTPIGGPLIGWIGEIAGPRWGLAVGGISAIAVGAVSAYVLRRSKQESETMTMQISS